MAASSSPRRLPGTTARVLLCLMILSAAAGAFWLLKSTRPQAPASAAQEREWLVQAIPATFERRAPEVLLYGRIESPAVSQLSSAVTAFVSSVLVLEGQRVSQGQTLIQLDDRDVRLVVEQRQAQVDSIRAQIAAEHTRHKADLEALEIEQALLTLARRAVHRFEALTGRQVGSQTQLDEARRNYQQQALALNNRTQSINDHPNRLAQLTAQLALAQAQLQTARLDLERTLITAPFAGRVTDLQVAAGDRVRSGDPLVSLFSTQSLEVRSQIPSRYLPRLRLAQGQDTALTATADLDGRVFKLTLDRLAASADSNQAGIDALLRFQHPDDTLTLGRTLPLTLRLPEEPDVLALPPQALYGLDQVYRITEGRLEAVPVERVGELSNGGRRQVLVRSDALIPGDQIVTTQLPNAISGLRVQVRNGAKTGDAAADSLAADGNPPP